MLETRPTRGVSLRCCYFVGALIAAAAIPVACSDDPSTTSPDGGGGSSNSDAGNDGSSEVIPTSPTIVITGESAVPRSPNAYGQNYWSWVESWGNHLPAVQTAVQGMKLNVLRAGGHNNDVNSPEAFGHDQIDAFVAYAKAVGAEPILQVPLLKDTTGAAATVATAAEMVTYANQTKAYGIKYWEVGNEPDLYASSTPVDIPNYTADDYATAFAAVVTAMKGVDPSIQVMGPELSWKYISGNDWLSPFLDKCASLVDIVSVHRYPFDAPDCTINHAMGDSVSFQQSITAVRATMTAHGAGTKPLAITEANFSWNGDPTKQTAEAALGTFYAGMWVADNLGVALEQQLWTVAYWSLSEGWKNGFFDDATNAPRPAVYAYELFSNHFGSSILHAKAVPTGFSAYASHDDTTKKTVVLVLNRTAQNANELIAFEGLSTSLTNQAIRTPAYSMTLVELPDDGGAPQTLQYTKSMADEGKGPQPLQ